MITDYQIVCGDDFDNFIKDIQDALKQGWELYGPLIVTPYPSERALYYRHYSREMVKHGPEAP